MTELAENGTEVDALPGVPDYSVFFSDTADGPRAFATQAFPAEPARRH